MRYTVNVNKTKTCWYKEGAKILHREDGPAIEYANGNKEWWLNGLSHREDGPAIEEADGYKAWWINGERHREDGPARDWDNGSKEWWVNGELHREDGPAREWGDGSKEWYLNDKELTEEEFNSRKPMNSITINGKTKEIPQEALDLLKDLL